MAGYSGTPLLKKLGIKERFRIAIFKAPDGFAKELGTLPAGITRLQRPTNLDFALFFARSEADLLRNFKRLARMLTPHGMLWIAWPKKSAGVVTDLSESVVRRIGLEGGLVDVKICAVNDVWSGLKFVYRLKDRLSR